MRDRRRRFGDGFAEYEADRKSTRLNSSHLVISYAVSFFKKNTRLNSSHLVISYAVFCLKKKKRNDIIREVEDLFNSVSDILDISNIERSEHLGIELMEVL